MAAVRRRDFRTVAFFASKILYGFLPPFRIMQTVTLGITDKFSTAVLVHLFRPVCVDKSST